MAQIKLDNTLSADIADALQTRMEQDLAFDIYPPEEIAERYGLVDRAGLAQWMATHPRSVLRIEALRAAHRSDSSVKERVQLKSQHALEQILPGYTNRLMHPTTPIREQTDGLKIIKGLAGMDGTPAADKQAAAGATFNLVMQFSSGTKEIRATVVSPPEIQGIAQEADDGVFEEDA